MATPLGRRPSGCASPSSRRRHVVGTLGSRAHFRGAAAAVGMLAAAALAGLSGCEPGSSIAPPPVAQGGSSPVAPDTPLETVRLARDHRLAGRLTAMGELVSADQRVAVVALVAAVDELVSADEALAQALAEAYGSPIALTFHRPNLANIIGVFSRDAEVVSESVADGRARVAVQVVDRLPLDYVEVIREEGEWRLRTDAPIAGLPEALREFARVLSSLARETRDGRYSFPEFEREYRLRTRGALREIRRLVDAG